MLARKKYLMIFICGFFAINVSFGKKEGWTDRLKNTFDNVSSSIREKISFLDAFRKNPGTVGSVVPSSRFLTQAIIEQIAKHIKNDGPPLNILEVGAGTGPFTREIAAKLRPEIDSFCAIECNKELCDILRKDLADYSNIEIIEASILDWDESLYPEHFDIIISGLPFKIFSSQDVSKILNKYESVLKPEGSITYFSYIGVNALRKIRSCFDSQQKKADQELFDVLAKFESKFSCTKNKVWFNFPPAYVHLLQRES